MTDFKRNTSDEPFVSVGLVERAESVTVNLSGSYYDQSGAIFVSGEYRITCIGGLLRCTGVRSFETERMALFASNAETDRFSLEATIGIDFHWQQKEVQTFCGHLRLIPDFGDRLTAINDLPIENYLTSVVCSEMKSSSPSAMVKAHSIISRSWLLAQIASSKLPEPEGQAETTREGEVIKWYDRQAHHDFDVCADDHCQRYQGIGRIESRSVYRAVSDTRGQVLLYGGKPCDTRYSKCCGGVTEDFRTAWSNNEVPYLTPVYDGPNATLPDPPLTDEESVRRFIADRPAVYCNCVDDQLMNKVLISYDRQTKDFFRWQVRLPATEASTLLKQKLGVDLGRLVSLEPVERGLSGRLKRLRIRGEAASLVIGKELEIRRALSPSHLYSSAFVVDIEGPAMRPDVFVLNGSGWGHGVGLCQIGAAAMAWKGVSHQDILGHYYPGTTVEKIYS